MINVKVKVNIKISAGGGMWQTEVFETQVDQTTFMKANSSIGKKELKGWLLNMFPGAIDAEIVQMVKT